VKLFTIGYEKALQPDVIAELKRAGAEVVIDVRAIASSRRAGFSKTLLAATLAEAGIGYIHLRDLGTPKAGRQAVRHGRPKEMEAIFAAHMEEPAAQNALGEARAIASDRPAALLCYEADPKHCHRSIVAGMLAQLAPFEIVHLAV
jgi:uncharacterized protein (DUF488 family)